MAAVHVGRRGGIGYSGNNPDIESHAQCFELLSRGMNYINNDGAGPAENQIPSVIPHLYFYISI